MESNVQLYLEVLALQIQMLTTNIEELTKQKEEMRQQLQKGEDRPSTKRIERNMNEDKAQRDCAKSFNMEVLVLDKAEDQVRSTTSEARLDFALALVRSPPATMVGLVLKA